MKRILGALLAIAPLYAADARSEQIRDAAKRAVAAIQRSQANWYHKQSCTSCHQQILPTLAFHEAREHGVPVDERAAHADATAAFGYMSSLDRAVEYTYRIDPVNNDGYALIAASVAGVRPSLVTAVYARLIAAYQAPDGHWDTIDDRPPQSYSPFTSTTIATYALQLYAHPSQKSDTAARSARAQAWLLSHQPANTEERTFQLFGACLTSADQATIKKMAQALIATQQSDGGWSSRDGRPSDAYSTGEVLFVLNEAAAVPATDPAWQRGINFLLKTQAKDGTWHTVSRLNPPAPVSPKYFETGHPYGHDQFISMMGESWAVMSLSAALGPAQKGKALVLKEADPPPAEPWVETLLFGSAADVKKLLDSGFDPNSTTKAGAMTPLMLAAPDLDKMKLLLDRGANADARSKNRFSALLVAAQYPGSAAAMNLLLDSGARPQLPKGEGAPQFNASATFLAAAAGNAEIIPRLKKAGDRIDQPMTILGFAPATAWNFLVGTKTFEPLGALLEAGANVNEVDPDGINGLGWAAIGDRIETARFLLRHSIDVNHLDSYGMTPLLYAASIDFSDGTMIDMLLQAGANPNAKTKEGLTALDLARKYNYTWLIPRLEKAGMNLSAGNRTSGTR